MNCFVNKFRERINLFIGAVLTTLGVGATGCDLLSDYRIVEDDINIPTKEDSVDVVVCKYGVPVDTVIPTKPDSTDPEIPDNPPDTGEIVCMYGVPSASFHIKGSVSDRKTGKALDRIQVLIDTRDAEQTVYTNEEGIYQFDTDWIFPTDSVFVTFTDENDKYEEKKVGEKLEYEGGTDFWNQGNANVRVDVQLDRKKK